MYIVHVEYACMCTRMYSIYTHVYMYTWLRENEGRANAIRTVIGPWMGVHSIYMYIHVHGATIDVVLFIQCCLSRGSRFGLDVTSCVEYVKMSTNSTSISSMWRVQN